MTKAQMRLYIREFVDTAPPLSDAQRTGLAELLRPIREKYSGTHRSEWELAR